MFLQRCNNREETPAFAGFVPQGVSQIRCRLELDRSAQNCGSRHCHKWFRASRSLKTKSLPVHATAFDKSICFTFSTTPLISVIGVSSHDISSLLTSERRS